MTASTLFEKVWDAHVVEDLGDGWVLLYIDRHLLHDLSGPPAIADLRERGLHVRQPGGVFATPDHLIASAPDRTVRTNELGAAMWAALEERASAESVRILDGDGQGIVHVIGPEQGIVLPGLTIVCGDSHTCTNGALGAIAFGIGNSQSTQALATSALLQQRPLQFRITLEGAVQDGVTSKDLALHLIAQLGASAGAGYAIEYAGPAVEAIDVESRMTLCNLTIELGAKFGIIAPDETTFEWVRGRRFAPTGPTLDAAITGWRLLRSDADASFDREYELDASEVRPMVSWGTSPEHAVSIDGRVPMLDAARDDRTRAAWISALEYMDLRPGSLIAGTPIEWVFIGSCANSRLSDLRDAARVAGGRSVARGVTAWVVPGSEQVRADAEAEGLHEIFLEAGFEWRRPGCSMCVAANGDRVPRGTRCVSTSNRNFVGRQGPGARTHLASPATAAAAAITGELIDHRTLSALT